MLFLLYNPRKSAYIMQAEFQQKLLELKNGYVASLPDVIAKIEQATNSYIDGQREPDEIREFYRAVHSLTGSGATYGFQQISTDARALANVLKPCLEEGCLYPPVDIVRQLYFALEASIMTVVKTWMDEHGSDDAKGEHHHDKRLLPASMKILVADDD